MPLSWQHIIGMHMWVKRGHFCLSICTLIAVHCAADCSSTRTFQITVKLTVTNLRFTGVMRVCREWEREAGLVERGGLCCSWMMADQENSRPMDLDTELPARNQLDLMVDPLTANFCQQYISLHISKSVIHIRLSEIEKVWKYVLQCFDAIV